MTQVPPPTEDPGPPTLWMTPLPMYMLAPYMLSCAYLLGDRASGQARVPQGGGRAGRSGHPGHLPQTYRPAGAPGRYTAEAAQMRLAAGDLIGIHQLLIESYRAI